MKQIYRFFFYILLGFTILLTLGIAILESGPGKKLAASLLESGLKNSGLSIQIGSVSGSLPHEIELRDVQIQNVLGKNISIEQMDLSLSLIRLLKRELCIDELIARGVTVVAGAESSGVGSALPFTLTIKSFEIQKISIPEIFNAAGHLKLKRGAKSGFLACTLTRPEFEGAGCDVTAYMAKQNEIELHIYFKTPTLAALNPWIPMRAEGAASLQVDVRGNLDAYSGKFSGKFDPTLIALPSPLDELAEREWTFRGKLKKVAGKNLQFKQLLASSKHLRLKGSVDLDEQYFLSRGRLQMQTDLETLPRSPVSGRLYALADVERIEGGLGLNVSWEIPQVEGFGLKVEDARGLFRGSLLDRAVFGSIESKARFLGENWEVKTPVAYRPDDALFFEKIEIDSPLMKAGGDLAYRADGLWVGKVTCDRVNLQVVHKIRPEIPLYGFGSFGASLEVVEGMQTVGASLEADEVYLGSAYARRIGAKLDWREDVKGSISIDLCGGKYQQMIIDSGSLVTASKEEVWPFHIELTGSLREEMQGALDGFWSYRDKEFLLNVEEGSGTLLRYPILLQNPAVIRQKNGAFSCKDLKIAVGLSQIYFNFEGRGNDSDAQLVLDAVPLDFLSLNPLDVAVSGTVSLDAEIQERNGKVKGELHTSIENMEVKIPGEANHLLAHGAFQGFYDSESLELTGGLQVSDTPLLTLDLKLPIHFELWPMQAHFLLDKKAAGHVTMKGRIEDFLDFFDLGTHRLEGECICDLTLKNTLGSPRVEGSLQFEDAYYQNYFTGTELVGIKADLVGEGDHLYLKQFTAQDGKKKGNLSAAGSLKLSAKEKFPFRVDAHFDRLNIVQIDFMTAEAEGRITMDGNLDSALAKGTVNILETDMTIPDRLARKLPELQVVYKNAPKPIAYQAPHLVSPYPLNLDLKINAPDGIFIGGRGLQSEWKGDFHIGGTYTSLAPKGKLELINGEFVFAGRTFKLTDGAVTLSGKERQMPHLDIAGNLSEKGVSITARLRGPLNQPQLTFQSIPPLPMSGILSYLLFGEDLSNIDGFQALQLAATVASIAGEGPDLLESTRKSIGIDRLRIISTPGGDEDSGDRLALQVGKYVAKGVIVSFSQGTEDSSTNISIEVDIGAGFYFQAESVQQEEQGKFTIKWNLNY